jgi:hypothetical protein
VPSTCNVMADHGTSLLFELGSSYRHNFSADSPWMFWMV